MFSGAGRRETKRGARLQLITSVVLVALALHAAPAEDGFESIFNGKTLDGWYALPKERAWEWTAENGLLVGHTEGEGSDLIFDEELADFELRLSYRFRTKGNSGIHIRGHLGESDSHRVSGYHADFGSIGQGIRTLGAWDFHGYWRGNNLANRGMRVTLLPGGKRKAKRFPNRVRRSDFRRLDWNDVRVVVKGYRFSLWINGRLSSEVIDEEFDQRIASGVIGLQTHVGGPMTVEFRDVQLKRL